MSAPISASERTSLSVTLMICYLIPNKQADQVRACAQRLVALESNNVSMLKQLSTLDNESIEAIMNNLLLYIHN